MIIAALTTSMPQSGLGTSTFAAALDMIDAGQLSQDIDPVPVVAAYVQSIQVGHYGLSANRVSISGALSLFELALRTPAELRQKFLYPIDVKAQLAAHAVTDENPVSVEDTVARALRAHIRILGRVMAGWKEVIPDELAGALIATVRAGALKHEERGRIAAFAAGFEADHFSGHRDRPIAADLGAALSSLSGEQRERLLAAVLETDEPMLLAQLLSFAPRRTRAPIERRISDLTPSEAGTVYTLTAVQARIEALLSAGLASAAAQFIEAEASLGTGRVLGHETVRLRDTLRLHLLRGEWAAIASTEPPPALRPGEQSTAAETIEFYKALAALHDPNGSRQWAEHVFARLQGRRPDVAAYAIDLLAVRINLLLGPNLFGQLRGAESARGRQVLADAEQMMLQARAVTPAESEMFRCNKALLLLALGQPDRAHELLTPLHAERLGGAIAAYTAVALARTGRVREAMATLDRAIQDVGDTDVLRATRAHIETGKAFLGVASSLIVEDNLLRAKTARSDFLQLDPIRQAEVLQPAPEPFDTFVIECVRSAAESVTSLVPMMNVVEIDLCEDDLTALLAKLLSAQLHFLAWSVPDQSRGGYTAKENPGERDLVLMKDSTTLAVLEAVVCNRPVTQAWIRQRLTNHFQKLFAYSSCRLFFHLTYSYIDNPAAILTHLKQAAEQDAPPGFTYLHRDEIPFTDSRPIGFAARYAGQFGEVKVVFLLLDLGQHQQIDAAKAAAVSGSINLK